MDANGIVIFCSPLRPVTIACLNVRFDLPRYRFTLSQSDEAVTAAVPAEAFDESAFDDRPTNPLVHDEWRAYTNRTWSCKWNELFPTSDDRSKLTWRGRFSNVPAVAYNFYSSGDEVFELFAGGTPDPTEGGGIFDWAGKGRYAWHKQEAYKGRAANISFAWAGTDWSGWGFHIKEFSDSQQETERAYTPYEAACIPIASLTTNTVFHLYPATMNTNVISRAILDEHLAKGIPALSPAIGRENLPSTFEENLKSWNMTSGLTS